MVNDNLTILLIPYSLLFIYARFQQDGRVDRRSVISLGFFLCLVESLLGGFEAYNFAFAADMEVWQPFYT